MRRVFRGVETPHDITLARTTALHDYQLVPRHEEAEFCRLSPERAREAVRVLPSTLPKPPLLLVSGGEGGWEWQCVEGG